jgi:hypothetical protein
MAGRRPSVVNVKQKPTKNILAKAEQLTPAEIESLQRDKRLSLSITRLLCALDKARQGGAGHAEIERLQKELSQFQEEKRLNDLRSP